MSDIDGNWIGVSKPGDIVNGVQLGCNNTIVRNNQFVMNSAGYGVVLVPDLQGATPDNCEVTENIFTAGARGVVATVTNDGLIIRDNFFNGQTEKYIRIAPSNRAVVKDNKRRGSATFVGPITGDCVLGEYNGHTTVTLAGGASQHFTVTIPAGVFQNAPNLVTTAVNGASVLPPLYRRADSTATLLAFSVVPSPISGASLPSVATEFSFNAKLVP